MLDLFTKNTDTETADTETADSENLIDQSPLATENTQDTENSAEKNDSPSSDAVEDSDSITAYMEKLLERSRGGKSGTASLASAPQKSKQESKTQTEHGSNLSTSSILESAGTPANNSMSNNSMQEKLAAFNKAPTHSQDKDAVRDAMNSFRDVANYSARMAIARHSQKHQRTDLIFKGVLTGICVLISIIIFAEYFWGINRLSIMKWAALAISIASISQFHRAYNEAKKLFPGKKPKGANATKETQETEAVENEHLHFVNQADQEEESLDETLNAVNGIREQLELLSAEEEEVQSLEEKFKQNDRSWNDQTASLLETEDQREIHDFERDEDQ